MKLTRHFTPLLLLIALNVALAAAMAAAEPAGERAESEASGVPAALPLILDLESAKRLALEQNPTTQAAQQRVAQANARVKQARAAYFPRVEASGAASKTWLSQNALEAARARIQGSSGGFNISTLRLFGAGAGTDLLNTLTYQGIQEISTRKAMDIGETTESYTASLAVSWLVFDGLERRFTHLAAQYGERELDAAYAEARRLLMSAVAAVYYATQLARENITIAEADEAFNARLLEEAEARRRVGTGSLSDELNFRVGLNAARNAVINAELERDLALAALAELLAVPGGAFPEGFALAPLEGETAGEMAEPDVEAKIAEALSNRPDLRQREYAVQRAGAIAKARRGPFMPTVTARYSQDAQLADEADFEGDDFSATAAVRVDYTLFAGGLHKQRLREAQYARDEAAFNLHEAENRVIQEVREAHERVKASQRTLVLQRLNAEHAQRNRDLTEKEYNAGQGSLTRLNQAQRDLLQAQAALALARVSLRSAWHDLRTATAETLTAMEGAE